MNENITEKINLIDDMLLSANDSDLVDIVFYFIREKIKSDHPS